jgi:hypothetical protein
VVRENPYEEKTFATGAAADSFTQELSDILKELTDEKSRLLGSLD